MAARDVERPIGTCIRSLFQQTHENWELIVVDDGSQDGTSERIQSFVDPRIHLRIGERSEGLAARLNQAMDIAHGKYFARIDADDVAYPDRLERQVAFLESHPEVDLVGTGAMVFSENGQAIGLFPARQAHEDICAKPWAGFYLPHPSWMGRCAWFRRNRYRPTMQKAQDQELLLRTFRHSRFACLPEILIGYRQDRLSLRKILEGRRNFCTALVRNAPEACGYGRTAYALMEQVVKGVIDTVAITAQVERQLLKHRAQPPSRSDVKAWERVWTQCSHETKSLCVG